LDVSDTENQVSDLLPGLVEREIRKAYTAFSSRPHEHGVYTEIFTGLWGCGAFGGDWQIKTIVQWCAAAKSCATLHFVCAGDQQQAFATTLDEFTQFGLESGWIVGDVLKALSALDPGSSDARNTFTHVKSVLSPH